MEQYNSVEDIYEHFQDPGLPPNAGQLPGWSWFTQVFSRRGAVKGASHKHLPKQSSLMGESGKLDTDKFFGRTKGWGSSPDDLESAVFSDKLDGMKSHLPFFWLLTTSLIHSGPPVCIQPRQKCEMW